MSEEQKRVNAYGARLKKTKPEKPAFTCHCKRGLERDNCPNCEGTGYAIDWRAWHAQRKGTDKE